MDSEATIPAVLDKGYVLPHIDPESREKIRATILKLADIPDELLEPDESPELAELAALPRRIKPAKEPLDFGEMDCG